MIASIENIACDGNLGAVSTAGLRQPGCNTVRRRIAGCLFVEVHEDIAFYVSVSPVEIDTVIRAAHEDVVDNLKDRARAFCAEEVNDVSTGVASFEDVVFEGEVFAVFDVFAMDHFTIDAMEDAVPCDQRRMQYFNGPLGRIRPGHVVDQHL